MKKRRQNHGLEGETTRGAKAYGGKESLDVALHALNGVQSELANVALHVEGVSEVLAVRLGQGARHEQREDEHNNGGEFHRCERINCVKSE